LIVTLWRSILKDICEVHYVVKTEDKKDFELSFRPVADPTEIINEKTDKKDIIITIFLYVVMAGIIIYNLI